MWNAIISTGIALAISVGSWLGIYHQQTEWDKQVQDTIKNYTIQSQKDNKILGATLPIAGSTYTLSGSGISSSATSFTLSSFTIPQNGYEIQDSDISDTFYMTVEPGSKTRQEIIACTTVAQNSTGTATISGCSRGMSPISPYTASTTLQFAHSGGTQVILSDPPQLFEQYFTLDNDNQTISGVVNFSVNPILTTATSSLQAINKAYADALAIAGAPDSSASVKGIVEMASALETASSTNGTDGDTTAFLVPSTERFTANATTTYAVPVSRSNGQLDENWIATSSPYNWTGQHTFKSGLVGIGTTTPGVELGIGGNLITSGTTTTGSLVATTTDVKIGGIPYEFPGAQGAASTILQNNGSGQLSWASPATSVSLIPQIAGLFATTTVMNNLADNTIEVLGAYVLPFTMVVNKITFSVDVVNTSGTVDVTVYSEDGQTQEIAVTSGTITTGGNATIAVSAVTLNAGVHYIGINTNTTADLTIEAYGGTESEQALHGLNSVASEPNYAGHITITASTPAATVTTTGLTKTNVYAPYIFRLDN